MKKERFRMAKTLKNNIYKNIASILASDNARFKTAQNIVLFSRVLSEYPSKSIYYLVAERLINFIEKNVNSVSLIIEVMRDEGEDEEIVNNVELLHDNPTIKTSAEVTRLCVILADYIKYAKILKIKNSFISTMDIIDEDDANIKNNVETLYKMSTDIVNAYNSVNVSSVTHSFDTCDVDAMKSVVAEAKDVRSPNKIIITGIRGLNNLLSPGYLPGCVYVYAALPGNYKSGILLESHVDTCKYNEHLKETTNGKTPISMYISMENTMAQTIRRLWSILFPTADMSMFTVDEITEMINNSLTEKGIRSVILYYGYREKSTNDLANIIRSYNDDENEVVAVYLDYIKRIRPGRTDASVMASEKSELHAIMNELKVICADFNIPIVTGHQLNREAARAVDTVVANGGYNKTNEVLGRSQVSVA
jgi:replicative DNA helicase